MHMSKQCWNNTSVNYFKLEISFCLVLSYVHLECCFSRFFSLQGPTSLSAAGSSELILLDETGQKMGFPSVKSF